MVIDESGAETDGLRLNYAPLYIEQLRHNLANSAQGTPFALLAVAKLHASENDLSAAWNCLTLAFQVSGVSPAPDWNDYVLTAIVCRQLGFAQRLLNDRFGACPEFRLRPGGDISRVWPINAMKYRIIDRMASEFEVHQSLYENRHIEFLIERWLSVLPMLSSFARRHAEESGTVVLNFGDVGSHPGLAFCENREEFFLIPDSYFMASHAYREVREHFADEPVEWKDRTPVAFWRGGSTGRAEDPEAGWRSLPRVKLCEISQSDRTGIFDVGISRIAVRPGDRAGQEIASSGLMRPYVPATEFQRYKYQIDIDGHSNSWPGLFQKLLTGSAVLKIPSPTGFRQWYYSDLKPWVHFIPVSGDMSDLGELVHWLRDHDEIAQEIGRRGRALALAMDHDTEVRKAGRVIGAALRYFAGRPELELRFGDQGGNGDSLRGDWGDRRIDGIETSGFESRLQLQRPVQNEAYVLALEVSPAGDIAQPIAVVANGAILLDTILTRRQILHCCLPAPLVQADAVLSITLLHPNARPAACGAKPLRDGLDSAILHRLSLTLARAHESGQAAVEEGSRQDDNIVAPTPGNPEHSSAAEVPSAVWTHHETVIYVDETIGALRHGPPKSSPRNAGIVRSGDLAWLCHLGRDGLWRKLGDFGGSGRSMILVRTSHGAGREFQVMAAKGAAFGLAQDGLLLCAESDGRMTLSRNKLGPWESFRSETIVAPQARYQLPG